MEMTALRRAVRRMHPGRAGWVQLVGEPGIGKTRLLVELTGWAEQEGCLALTGRGAELERNYPFGVFVDALDDHLGGLRPDRLDRLIGGSPGELAGVFPAVSRVAAAPPAGLADERYRVYQAVRTLLETLAAAQPLLLILDDVHWADPSSRELVSFLLRRPPAARLLLVLAWRRGQASELTSGIAAAARDNPGLQLDLGPLSAGEAAQLDSTITAEDLQESGGNPFYLLALARQGSHARTQRPLPGAPPGWPAADVPGLPVSVGQAVAAEIAALSPTARRMAQGAAVAGEPFEPHLAAICADVGEHGLAALDELISAEIAWPTDQPTRFRFRHPIVRRAVYASALPGWRLAAHARAADALAVAGASPQIRAHHVALSAAPGDLAAVRVLTEAAWAAHAQAPAVAAGWWATALGLLPDPGVSRSAGFIDQRLHILRPLAAAAGSRGDLTGALAALEQVVELLPDDDAGRVAAIADCAAVEHGLGRFDAARQRLERALAEVDDRQIGTRGPLQLELAFSRLFVMDFPGALEWATLAADQRPGNTAANRVTALALCLFIHCCGEDFPTATAAQAAVAAEVDGLSPEQLFGCPQAAYYLGAAELLLGCYRQALGHLQAAVTAGGPIGARVLVPALKDQARTLAALGRVAEAQQTVDTAVDIARLTGNDWLTAFALAAAVEVRTVAGDLDGARRAAAGAVELTPPDAYLFRANIERQAAMVDVEAGRTGRALAGLDATGGPEFTVADPGTRWLVHEASARAHALHGNLAAAAAAADRAGSAAAAAQLPIAAVSAARARAYPLMAAGRSGEAVPGLLAAVSAAETAGSVLDTARTRLLTGRALFEAGRVGEATAMLLVAEQALRAAGAVRSRDEAAQLLRRLGVRQPGLDRSGAGPARELTGGTARLSGREHQIAALVLTGRSNREIATELHLSEKTVETHLSHLYVKLGIHRRGGLAAALAADNLPATTHSRSVSTDAGGPDWT